MPFDIPGLRQKNFFDQYMQNPYAGGLSTPGLMDAQPKNPFGGLFQPNVQSFSPQEEEPENPIDEYIRLMRELYHPNTTASNRFNDLINNFPQERRPSLGRTLVGVGAGLAGGPQASQEIMDQPYRRDLEKWKLQTEPAYRAAEVERQGNDTQRVLTGNVISAQMGERKNRIAEEKNRITEAKNTAQAETARIRALAYDYKNHQWTIKEEGSRLIAINPNTLERKDLGASGDMDRRDLENLKGEWGVKRAEASGMSAIDRVIAAGQISGRGLIQVGGKTYIPDPDNPGNYIEVPGLPEGTVTRPGTPPTAKTPNARVDQIERNDIFRRAFDNPTTRKWIIPPASATGDYQLKEPPKLGRMFTPNSTEDKEIEEYNQILKALGQPLIKTRSTPVKPFTGGLGFTGTPQGEPSKMRTKMGIPAGDVISPEDNSLQQKAAEFLRSHGQQATPANIQYAIKQGWIQ